MARCGEDRWGVVLEKTRFAALQSRGLFLTARHETGFLFLSPLILIPLIGPFLSDLSFSPSSFFSLLRKWPWRVGRLWGEASQSRWRNEGGDSSHAGFPDTVCELVCVRAFQQGVVSVGWSDMGVGFRSCLGNEAETILLKLFLSQTGKVTFGS